MGQKTLVASTYTQNQNFGGGPNQWQNPSNAGASSSGSGANRTLNAPGGVMNFLFADPNGAVIPTGSVIRGIQVNLNVGCSSSASTGGTVTVFVLKNSVQAGNSKTVAVGAAATVGPFGGPTDLWGITGLTAEYFSSGIGWGQTLSVANMPNGGQVFAWNYSLTVFYDDPVPQPTTLTASGGSNQSANTGTAFPVQLFAQVKDQGGFGYGGATVQWTLPASGASGTFPGAVRVATANTDASGVASSPFITANATVGAWNPVVTVPATPSLPQAIYYLTNTTPPPAPIPTTIAVQQGDAQSATVLHNFAILQRVRVWDQLVHPLPNCTIQWNVPAGAVPSGTYPGGQPAFSTTDSNGIAYAPQLTANNRSGNWTATVNPQGYPAVTGSFSLSNLADNSPPQANNYSIVSGSGQLAATSAAFAAPIIVNVVDQYGSPFAGAPVTFTSPNTSSARFGSTSGPTTLVVNTDASGNASSGVIFAGVAALSYNITVAVSGIGGSSNVPLTNINPSTVTGLQVISGNSQTTPPSQSFPAALVCRAFNGLAQGVPGVTITFTAPGSSASCRFSGALTYAVATDANGMATSLTPTATASLGGYNVSAADAASHTCSFSLQNGNNYTAEVCTAMEVPPGGGRNTSAGAVGTPASWSSPSLCGSAAAGGSFALCSQPTPNTNRSNGLAFFQPASWAVGPTFPIKSDSLITSMSLQASMFFNSSGSGTGAGNASYCLLKSNVPFVINGTTFISGALMLDTWSASGIKKTTFTSAQTYFGSDLAASAFSTFCINVSPASNQTPGATYRLNGVMMSLCYQNVIPPPQRIIVPLEYCPM
jgi:hypothetical protein